MILHIQYPLVWQKGEYQIFLNRAVRLVKYFRKYKGEVGSKKYATKVIPEFENVSINVGFDRRITSRYAAPEAPSGIRLRVLSKTENHVFYIKLQHDREWYRLEKAVGSLNTHADFVDAFKEFVDDYGNVSLDEICYNALDEEEVS